MNEFADKLKELMQENNLSQSKLSKETGISQSNIARWLACLHEPNMTNLILLAKYFKCSIDFLVGLEN